MIMILVKNELKFEQQGYLCNDQLLSAVSKRVF